MSFTKFSNITNFDSYLQIGLYLLFIAIVGAIIAFIVNKWIAIQEQGRRKSLNIRELEEPVEPENNPIESPEVIVKKQGLRSIEKRFRIIRRFLVPLLVAFWLLIATIPALGAVPATYVSLVVGALTVILGIAAKPWIENFIAGLVITLGKTVRIGDTVTIDNQYGTVEEITLVHTIIKIWDWRRYVIPNHRLLQKEFINLTLQDNFFWKSVSFHISPDADLEVVEKLAIQAVKSSDKVINGEEISFWVMEMNCQSTECWIAAWAASPADAWTMSHEIRMELSRTLRENGIGTSMFRVSQLGAPHLINQNKTVQSGDTSFRNSRKNP